MGFMDRYLYEMRIPILQIKKPEKIPALYQYPLFCVYNPGAASSWDCGTG